MSGINQPDRTQTDFVNSETKSCPCCCPTAAQMLCSKCTAEEVTGRSWLAMLSLVAFECQFTAGASQAIAKFPASLTGNLIVQQTDPGAVGSGVYWLQNAVGSNAWNIFQRDNNNAAWAEIALFTTLSFVVPGTTNIATVTATAGANGFDFSTPCPLSTTVVVAFCQPTHFYWCGDCKWCTSPPGWTISGQPGAWTINSVPGGTDNTQYLHTGTILKFGGSAFSIGARLGPVWCFPSCAQCPVLFCTDVYSVSHWYDCCTGPPPPPCLWVTTGPGDNTAALAAQSFADCCKTTLAIGGGDCCCGPISLATTTYCLKVTIPYTGIYYQQFQTKVYYYNTVSQPNNIPNPLPANTLVTYLVDPQLVDHCVNNGNFGLPSAQSGLTYLITFASAAPCGAAQGLPWAANFGVVCQNNTGCVQGALTTSCALSLGGSGGALGPCSDFIRSGCVGYDPLGVWATPPAPGGTIITMTVELSQGPCTGTDSPYTPDPCLADCPTSLTATVYLYGAGDGPSDLVYSVPLSNIPLPFPNAVPWQVTIWSKTSLFLGGIDIPWTPVGGALNPRSATLTVEFEASYDTISGKIFYQSGFTMTALCNAAWCDSAQGGGNIALQATTSCVSSNVCSPIYFDSGVIGIQGGCGPLDPYAEPYTGQCHETPPGPASWFSPIAAIPSSARIIVS